MNGENLFEQFLTPAEFDGENWSSAGFVNNGAEAIALVLLSDMDGMSVAQIREVLRRAERLLDATTLFDAEATSFRKAYEVYRRAGSKSP